jgi:hypothetical protein
MRNRLLGTAARPLADLLTCHRLCWLLLLKIVLVTLIGYEGTSYFPQRLHLKILPQAVGHA